MDLQRGVRPDPARFAIFIDERDADRHVELLVEQPVSRSAVLRERNKTFITQG